MPKPSKRTLQCRTIRKIPRRKPSQPELPPLTCSPPLSTTLSPPETQALQPRRSPRLQLLQVNFTQECACAPIFTCESCMAKAGESGSLLLERFWREDIEGEGLRTRSRIESGTFVIEYKGKRFRTRIEGPYVLEVRKGRLWLDGAVEGNENRFINHSCEPNCVLHIEPLNARAMIFAARMIEEGEELTLRYSKDELPFACVCRQCSQLK